MTKFLWSRTLSVAIYVLTASVICGCAKQTVGVDVHGVNYSGNEFSYLLVNPSDPDRSSVGERIDPFAAGGTTCCYPLPKQWRPGIKVQIRTRTWLPKDPDGELPEVKEEHVAEVPPYVDGKPGELWVVREGDGSVSVVSSDFQPDHPKWPGKLRGWPVPSLEYRRERWELFKKYEEGGVQLYLSMLDELKREPVRRAREDWNFAKEHDPQSISSFSGPDDPRYLLSLKKEYEEGLERSKASLKNIMEAKP